jgi:hypothetical protein
VLAATILDLRAMLTQYSLITVLLHPPSLTATDLGETPSDVDRSGVCRIIEEAVRRDSVESLFHDVCDPRRAVPPALMILLIDNNRKHPNHLYLLKGNCSWLTLSLYAAFYTWNEAQLITDRSDFPPIATFSWFHTVPTF